MRVTRRYWETAGLGVFLAALAVVLAHPLLLYGAAALGAWLLATQYAFVHGITTITHGLTVEQTLTPRRAPTDDPIQVTVTATIQQPTPLNVSITPDLPVSISGPSASDRSARITRGETQATTSFSVEASVAGRYELPSPRLAISDSLGLYEETLVEGDPAILIGEPRTPRNVHVGQGGNEYAAAFGDHPADQKGAGLDPAEIRRYLPGDPANHIDWKATARLQEPHVREFNAETDRETTLVVDHRDSMSVGRDGETKLDYAREVALALVDAAAEWNDPLGYYAVADDGITAQYHPDTTPDQYTTIRTTLHDLRPLLSASREHHTRVDAADPGRARRVAARLSGGEDAFATRLTPYFSAIDQYVERIESRPLFHTVQSYVTRRRGQTWTLVFTDDAQPTELTETLKLLRRYDGHAVVFITPTVLFEPGGLADIERAYERYREFESRRRELDRLEHVTALEVAPGDRLDALLTANRRAHARQS